MKLFFGLIIIALTGFCAVAQNLTIMTYNIRVEVRSDTINGWNNRKDAVTSLVKFYNPDILSIQEGLKHQLDYINTGIGNYQYIGRGRTDGGTNGEYSAIFYNSEKFEVVMDSTFWLSETPGKPSRGWDAAYDRVCTYALLRDKASGNLFWVFNTHLDNAGPLARLNGARLITQRIAEALKFKSCPVVLTGDMNCSAGDEPVSHFTAILNDSRTVSEKTPYGPEGTFNGFDLLSPLPNRIDFILVSKNNITVKKYFSIDDRYANNKWPSDHLPVFAELELN